MQHFEWISYGGGKGKYVKLNVAADAYVRTVPDYTGRFLWTFGTVYDHADTVEEAKEMVEGLAVAHHLEIVG